MSWENILKEIIAVSTYPAFYFLLFIFFPGSSASHGEILQLVNVFKPHMDIDRSETYLVIMDLNISVHFITISQGFHFRLRKQMRIGTV